MTAGKGPVRGIRPGDAVRFAPGKRHWHGAAPDTGMTHIAVQEALDGSNVTCGWSASPTPTVPADPDRCAGRLSETPSGNRRSCMMDAGAGSAEENPAPPPFRSAPTGATAAFPLTLRDMPRTCGPPSGAGPATPALPQVAAGNGKAAGCPAAPKPFQFRFAPGSGVDEQVVVLLDGDEAEVLRVDLVGGHALQKDLVSFLELLRRDADAVVGLLDDQVTEPDELRPQLVLLLGEEHDGVGPVLEVGDDVDAVALPEQELVGSLAAGEVVGVLAALQPVVAAVADEPVVVPAADEDVVALAALEPVGAVVPVERVVAAAAIEPVVALAANQTVVARPAKETVVAVVAVEGVVAGAAPENVIAVIAVEEVVALAALQDVVALAAVERVVAVLAVEAVMAFTAVERVVAIASVEVVLAALAVDGLAVAGAEQKILFRRPVDIFGFGRPILHVRVEVPDELHVGEVLSVLVQEDGERLLAVPAAGDELLRGQRYRSAIEGIQVLRHGDEPHVGLGHAERKAHVVLVDVEVFDDVGRLAAGVDDEDVTPSTAVEPVDAGPAVEPVVAAVANHGVFAGPAVERVVALPAADHVLAGTAPERVVAVLTEDLVPAVAAADRVVAGAAPDLVVSGAAVDPVVAAPAPHLVVELGASRLVAAHASKPVGPLHALEGAPDVADRRLDLGRVGRGRNRRERCLRSGSR